MSSTKLQTICSHFSRKYISKYSLSIESSKIYKLQQILSCQQYTSFSLTYFYSLPEVEIAVECSSEANKGRMLLYSLF